MLFFPSARPSVLIRYYQLVRTCICNIPVRPTDYLRVSVGCRLVVHLFALLSTTRVTVARVLLYRYSGVWYRYKSRSGMILFQTGRNLHSISSSSSSRAALSLGMPRVAFVAGGTGVVGRYLLTRLSRKGSPWDVVYAGGRRKLDITPEVGGCPIVSVEVDLTSPEDCTEKL